MERYYLAIDIGASSGRHILGHMEDGKMVLEEIYRFPNGMQKRDGEKVWDIEALFEAVLAGMKKCRELGKIPVSVGIDTWAVDFVLLDKDDQRIGNAVAYRDDRTKGMDEEVYRTVPEETNFQQHLSAHGVEEEKAGTAGKSRDSSDDSGLPEFPAFRRESAGIYQCDNNPACQPGNRRLEQGDDSKTGISGKNFPADP